MLQLNQELELDESRTFRHQVGSPINNSPPGKAIQTYYVLLQISCFFMHILGLVIDFFVLLPLLLQYW